MFIRYQEMWETRNDLLSFGDGNTAGKLETNQRSAMAAGRLIFSSALALNLPVFLLFSYLNSQSYCFKRRFSLNGHGSDTPRSALESSSMPYLDPNLGCFCRIRHFELKSWHTRMKRKRFLRRRLPYSANGTASFNPSILVNILSGDIHPQPGPNFTSNSSSTSTSTNANISFRFDFMLQGKAFLAT